MNERKESPLFTVIDIDNPTTGIYIAPINQKPYSKYEPYNNMRVVNNTDKSIIILINDTQQIVVPNNSIMTTNAMTTPSIRNLKVELYSDATGNINVMIWKTKAILEKLERLL